jgi:LacI family gluconate utilization system Gnt-I transcriptional repressor
MVEAQAHGLVIPKDLAVMGFGNLDFAAHIHPRLSTVDIDGGLIGRRTAEVLLQRIEGRIPRGTLADNVGFSLVVREST